MTVPVHLRYSAGHTWLEQAGDSVTIGVTRHAADGMRDIVYVHLPDIGAELSVGQPCGAVESAKTASDVDSPASGVVLTVNAALREDPGLVNRDPFGAGWLFRLRVTDLGATMTAEEYAKLMMAPFPDTVC
ncbi:glycine cleavage system protein GcvH [Dactylosporangium sp. NPDC050688]|uniref:glycine cleavage system protein GcvH n=1 Tax=Dactylosporangium sp. NPDC050688 TaxID=3157217 RepID=UPI0033F6D161